MYILHLSDLHFRLDENEKNWYSQLAEDLKNGLNCNRLDAIIVSGDIADHSLGKEYASAVDFFSRVHNEFRVPDANLIFVPGNHDVDWNSSKESYVLCKRKAYRGLPPPERFIEYENNIAVRDDGLYKKRFDNFNQAFLEKIKKENYPAEYEKQGILYHLPEHDVLVLGLNSAWNTDHSFTDRASICPEAVSGALDEIRRDDSYGKCLKIAVWHHPLASSEDDRIRDHGFMQRLAQAGFRVALHGHIHKAEASFYHYEHSADGRKIDIISAGTFGAPAKQWVPGYPLQYNLIKLEGDTLTVETRCRRELSGAWQPDAIWKQGQGRDPLPRYRILIRWPQDPPYPIDPVAGYLGQLCGDLSSWQGLGLARDVSLQDIYIIRKLKPSDNETELPDNEIFDLFMKKETGRGGKRWLISAQAGAGKTFLLRNWALQLADPASSRGGPLPIYIPFIWANHFLAEHGWETTLSQLAALIYPDPTGRPSAALVEALDKALLSGNAVVFFDGADEVKAAAWENIFYWIKSVCRSLMRCSIILSSRPTKNIETLSNFKIYTLRVWDIVDQTAFITRWFKYSSVPSEKVGALLKNVRESQRLQAPELAGNPLFLTMLCTEYERFDKILDKPAALFDRFSRILLDEWRPAVTHKMRFSLEDKMRILEKCAYDFFELELVRFPRRDLIAGCGEVLGASDPMHVEEAIDEIETGSGLLRKDRFGFVQFNHLLFQEFFYARFIASLDETDQKAWLAENLYLNDSRYEHIKQFYFELLSLRSAGGGG
jgi:predicted phosphodiesterase